MTQALEGRHSSDSRTPQACRPSRARPSSQPSPVGSHPRQRTERPAGAKEASAGRLPRMWYALGVKPHPRIRKTVKWGGAVVTVQVVVVWIGSGWVGFTRITGDQQIDQLARGRVTHEYLRFGFGTGIMKDRRWWISRPPRWDLGFEFASDPRGFRRIYVPLWIPAMASASVTGACWLLDARARRRARVGFCPKCNYDRTGLRGGAGAVCPECGAAASGAPGVRGARSSLGP